MGSSPAKYQDILEFMFGFSTRANFTRGDRRRGTALSSLRNRFMADVVAIGAIVAFGERVPHYRITGGTVKDASQ